MIGLFRAELRRFTSRRLMRVLAIGALALLVLVLGRIAMISRQYTVTHEPPPPFIVEREIQRCEESKARGEAPPDLDCSQIFGSPQEIQQETYVVDERVHARSALQGSVVAATSVVALLAFLAAASFVGAEWHHGTMQALLFWEPRRKRVLAVKAVAAVVASVAFLLVMQVLTYLGTYLVAATRGTTTRVTTGVHLSNMLLGLRGAVFVAIIALLAYAIAGLARITGAALGTAFVYFAIVENVILAFRPGWERWLITRNMGAILSKKVTVQPASRPRGQSGFEDGGFFDVDTMFTLTGVRGTVTLAFYLALLLGAYFLVFTRRDVT